MTSVKCSPEARDFCYSTLKKVSRSFAVVIEQLPLGLRDPVCVFYLVLRALDSVEDDMTYPEQQKIDLLRAFHQKLSIDDWSIKDVGDSEDYRILLANFSRVISVFRSLERKYQVIIEDIARRMGEGMADFVGKTDSIDTVENYNLYCHYVAGLVGHGLTEFFVQSELEEKNLDDEKKRLSNSMGLFLQKTNIIRDYREDLQAGRSWWPKEIWTKYADDLSFFSVHPSSPLSLECLNALLVDSLCHLPDVLVYLSRLRDGEIFRFCALPQLMAMGTLVELFNNPRVFTDVVKIDKALSWQLLLSSATIHDVRRWVRVFLAKIELKNVDEQLLEECKRLCEEH